MRIFVLGIGTGPHGAIYRLDRRSQFNRWPKENGVCLGEAGLWNILFRSGADPTLVNGSEILQPQEGDVLYVSCDSLCPIEHRKALDHWMENGGLVVGMGNAAAWEFAFAGGANLVHSRHDHPYAALAWVFDGSNPELIAPPRWGYGTLRPKSPSGVTCYGNVAVIHGERQTPARALISRIEDAPAILHHGRFWYLNGHPFAAMQSWLQGQEDLEPWIAWRHRLFWLDELGAYLCGILRAHRLLPEQRLLPALARTTVVFKHDVDDSRDTTYLDSENDRRVVGVYPILKDANAKYWVRKLASHEGHESAFHYNTASYSRFIEAARHGLLKLEKRPMRPNRKGIEGAGLLEQVRWAKRNGIGTQTLHRHAFFLLYPELIDALDTVFDNERHVLGSNSYFRGLVLRWGVDVADGMRGTYGSFPDPQFPYWFPFRLAHAGDGGRMLRGWESTSMMELEPGLVEQMLDYKNPHLSQQVFVFNYHPAHAAGRTFANGGCAPWFREVLELCSRRGVEIMTLADVYRRLNACV